MNTNSTWIVGAGLLMLAAGITSAERLGSAGSGPVLSPDRNQPLLSATEIIRYPDRSTSIARFDTRTGAIYRFRGSVDNPSVRNTWELRVPAVRDAHSGQLEIQQIHAALPADARITPDARRDVGRPTRGPHAALDNPVTFLVDVVSGDTWILRLRDNENGTWDRVEVFR